MYFGKIRQTSIVIAKTSENDNQYARQQQHKKTQEKVGRGIT